jgi:recombination protein RecT
MSKQLSVVDELKSTINTLKPQFKAALPKHITTEKFTRVLMTAVSSNPQLAEASRASLFASCMKLAQIGLLPDGSEAAIVTFRTKNGVMAKEMPMTKGLLKLVRNSGELASISPQVVYKNDEFSYWIDENGEHFKHVPSLTTERGDITHAYAMAKLKDGSIYLEVMSKEEIDKVRSVSKTKDSGPWVEWYAEMAKKSCLRRLTKRLPLSTDIEDIIKVDDDLYDLDQTSAEKDVSPAITKVEKKGKPNRLKEAIKAKVEEMPTQSAPDMSEEMPSFEGEPI